MGVHCAMTFGTFRNIHNKLGGEKKQNVSRSKLIYDPIKKKVPGIKIAE